MINPMSSFTFDSLYRPISAYSPFVEPSIPFPTLDVWSMSLMSDYMNNPVVLQQRYEYMYEQGRQYMANVIASRDLSAAVSNLSSLESQINGVITVKELNDEQKERLQEILDKIEALKEEIKNINQNSSAEEKEALTKQINNLLEEAAVVAKEIMEEIKETLETQDNDEEDIHEDDIDGDGGDSTPLDEDDTNMPVEQKLDNETENKALEICQSIYQGAIGCVGTDYSTILAGTGKITKDNVTAVLNKWQEQFANNSGDTNLIETLFDEEMMWNPSLHKRGADGKVINPKNNIDIIWNIVKCLEERAKELGVYKELIGNFTAAYDELDDTFVNQSKVENAVMAISQKVTLAENEKKADDAAAQKKADAQKAKDDKKAEAEKKKQQAETEAKKTFLDDMREIWKDDELEISDKVKYKSGKFVVRIEGKDYSGKDFNELCDKISDAGYDPKKYLSKQQLAVAA